MKTRTTLILALVAAFALACSDDDTTPAPAGDDAQSGSDATDAADDAREDTTDTNAEDAATPDTANDDGGTDSDDEVSVDVSEDTDLPEISADTDDNGSPQVDCHDLSYDITCDKPNPDANGYLACSDYFGDTTGVEVQCRAGVDVDVRNGPPCGSYEFYVGSCVYYTDALPTRCYVTHVGAISEDRVEPGRAFWRTACAGEWLEGD